MIFSILTIFPEMVRSFLTCGLLSKAIEKEALQVNVYDLRDFALDKHHKVDDRPFGGGPGMVMKPGPLFRAVDWINAQSPGRVVLFSAYAPLLTQTKVKDFSKQAHLILVCGRYEGVDQRFIEHRVDEEISIGPYVLMGGELAAGVLVESTARMLDGVIGNPESVSTDSYYTGTLGGWPQYTQPRDFNGIMVPDALLSGHHREIEDWRRRNRFVPPSSDTNEDEGS